MEEMHVFLSGRTDKQAGVRMYDGIVFCHKKEILIRAMWLNLENIMSSGISQT
jgi:hypothetical protein